MNTTSPNAPAGGRDHGSGAREVTVCGHGRRLGRVRGFIFNLDGVVTDTARLHAAAWQATFARHLPHLSARAGVEYVPFDPVVDYLKYLDGRPRYEAAGRFLAERGIRLPPGSAADAPGPETVCGLANDSHARFLSELKAGGVAVYPASMALIRHLKALDVALGVVSSSRACEQVLAAAGLRQDFDIVIDGVQLERLGVPGKPDPSSFLEGARELGVAPSRAAIVEDSVVGVQAARSGGFGLVVGVAHDAPDSHRAALADSADIVVGELDELEACLAAPGSTG